MFPNLFNFQSPDNGPNYQLDDVVVASKSLLRLEDSDTAYQKVKNWFLENHEVGQLEFLSQGRQALYLLLKNLDLPLESEVLIQGLSCVVVPNSIRQAGLQPTICDIDPTTYNISTQSILDKISAQTRVLVIQHNFGITANMDEIIPLCQRYNLILIEDCAHSLGQKIKYQGQEYLAGSFGHGAIFSFGRDKVISTTSGGALLLNHTLPWTSYAKTYDWEVNLQKSIQGIRSKPFGPFFQNLFYPILTTLGIRLFYHLLIGKILAQLNKKFQLGGKIYTDSEKKGIAKNFPKPRLLHPLLYPLLWNQLRKLPKFLQHKRKISQIYIQELDLKRPEKTNYMRFPVTIQELFPNQEITEVYPKILLKLKQIGVYPGFWYKKVFEGEIYLNQQKTQPKIHTKLPNIQKILAAKMLNLPIDIHINTRQAMKICQTIKNMRKELKIKK